MAYEYRMIFLLKNFGYRWGCVPLVCWRGNGPQRLRWIGVLRGRSPTLELRHGPNSYGRQLSRLPSQSEFFVISKHFTATPRIPPASTDIEARKCGYQTGLDTLVVHTVNDEYSLFAIYSKRPSESVKYSTWGVRRQR